MCNFFNVQVVWGCVDWSIINPWHACAAMVGVLGVCVSTAILTLQAMRQPMSDTSSFRTKRARKKATFQKQLRSGDMV